MSRTPFPKQRNKIIPNAEGRVLEIGIGSGLNLELYNQNKVTEIFSVDPDNVLLNKARRRAKLNNINLHIESLSAEELPFESKSNPAGLLSEVGVRYSKMDSAYVVLEKSKKITITRLVAITLERKKYFVLCTNHLMQLMIKELQTLLCFTYATILAVMQNL